MKKAIIALLAVTGLLAGFTAVYAATVPIVTDFYADSLQSGIGKTDTSFTLVRGTDSQSKNLSGPYGFTIDQGTASQENVFCTSVVGTTATGCTRGLDLTTGTTSVAALEQVHNRGASVQITTAPIVNILTNIMRGLETIPQAIFYDPSVTATSLQNGNPQALASIAVANAIGSTGCGNSSTSLRGCVQLSTNIQTASSTGTGSTGALLVIPTSIASSSPFQINDTGLHVVVSQNDDKINPNYIASSSAYTYQWAASTTYSGTLKSFGTTTISASSTTTNPLVLNGVPYSFPGAQGASSTVITTNGVGNLSFEPVTGKQYSFLNNNAVTGTTNIGGTFWATSTPMSVPAGVFTASSTIAITMSAFCQSTSSTCTFYLRDNGGTTLAQCSGTVTAATESWTGILNGYVDNQGSVSTQGYIFGGTLTVGVGQTNQNPVNCVASGTSSFNFATGVNLVTVVAGSGSSVATINASSIIVTP